MKKRKEMRIGDIRACWFSLSLSRKLQVLSRCSVVIILLSVATYILIIGWGMGVFDSILMEDSRTMEFWSAMEEEGKAFESYMHGENAESGERYREAVRQTEAALDQLLFDYEKLGPDRYARTWSIRNMYGRYTQLRDDAVKSRADGVEYKDSMATVYRIQEYLETYAGKLQQMTVEAGNQEYRRKLFLFYLVPLSGILWGGGILLLFQWLRRYMVQNVVRPVLALSEDARRISQNDFSGAAPESATQGQDEISRLIKDFLVMKQSTQNYIITLKEKHAVEKQLDEVRLQMLKNQINPHFLFNTLNMIASTAQLEDAVTTEKLITALSRLFRYNLKSTESVMPLERELKVVEDYMYLQKMRFGSRIRYTVECQPEAREILVPSFALQPLVENCIIHGLSHKGSGGKIHVRAWMKEDRLWISVADNGLGIPEERLASIRRELAERKKGKGQSTGIGLGNVCRRVCSMYRDGQFQVYSMEGKGTVVQMGFSVLQGSV
ncbi:MAG: sensor histidine kinase [Lachnospiraceae bacterium]|nr:sensor histidine kinase [Lachnospiraceae bacterium]